MSSKARSPGPSRPSVRGPTQVLLIVGSQVLGATGVEGRGHEVFQAGSSVHRPEAGSKTVSSSGGPQILASFPPTPAWLPPAPPAPALPCPSLSAMMGRDPIDPALVSRA